MSKQSVIKRNDTSSVDASRYSSQLKQAIKQELKRLTESLPIEYVYKKGTPHSAKLSTQLDFTLNIENFGPVSKGSVHLRPLTVFTGQNNSGKSYTSLLVHSIVSALRIVSMDKLADISNNVIQSSISKNGGSPQQFKASPILKNVRNACMRELEHQIETNLLLNFKSKPCELIKNGCKSSKITILNDNTINIAITDSVTAESKSTNKKINIKTSFKPMKIMRKTKVMSIDIKMDTTLMTILLIIQEYARSLISSKIIPYYIPPIGMKTPYEYNTLLADIHSITDIRNNPQIVAMPTDTKADFASSRATRNEKFTALALQMEKDMLGGNIELHSTNNDIPELMFTSKGKTTPLHRASNTVSEMVPLSMYLRYVAEPGGFLIINNPEGHLDPTNQGKLGKHIVKMIRAGLNILVNTQSGYLMGRLGQYVMAGMLEQKTRDKHTSPYKLEYLLPEEVSPYVFIKKSDGYYIREIEKTLEDGISQEHLLTELEESNKESVTLLHMLQKERDVDR